MVHVAIAPETLFSIFGLPVTNSLLTSWVVVLVLILIGRIVFISIKAVPGRIQSIAEIVIEELFSFLETIAGSKESVRKFFPVAATIFLFVLVSNWMGILPGVGSIGLTEHEEFVPLFRSVNSDLNMTLALALIVVTMSHVVGLVTLGLGHVGKFITFKSPTGFFVGILELVSELAKIISFSFRLFGNVFAGEVLLVIIAFLVPYIAPIPFLGLELFVGFVQALIFMVLTMMFLSAATVGAEHH